MALTDGEIDRIAERLARRAADGLDVEELLLHSLAHMEGSPGIVVDDTLARSASCRCVDNICFSRGIIGTLDEDQRGWACNPRLELDSPALKARIERFRDSAASCKAHIDKYPKGERLRPWLECMSRELRGPGTEELLPQTAERDEIEAELWARDSAAMPEWLPQVEIPEGPRVVPRRPSWRDIPRADQEAMLELREQGHGIGETAWRVRYPVEQVFRVLWRHLPEERDKLIAEYREEEKIQVLRDLRAESTPVPEEESARIHDLYNHGLSMWQIAKLTGRGMTSVHRHLSHPPRPPKRRAPEEIGKLIEQIVDLRRRRLPYYAIGERLGISTSYVLMLLRRGGAVIDTGDPARTVRLLGGQLYSVYLRVARRPSEETMQQAIRDLHDIADLALLRVETMGNEWADAEPKEWFELGWLRHGALKAAEVLGAGIACRLALAGRGPLMRVMGPRDPQLPSVRERLYRCIRSVGRVVGEYLVGSPAGAEATSAVQWAQTLLAQAPAVTAPQE